MTNEMLLTTTANVLNIKQNQVNAVISLSNEGCTIPFISRYRKEKTENLDEVTVNNVLETYEKVYQLEKRRDYIIKYLEENHKLTPELKKSILNAETLSELEDIYLPYKPRKKTLADKASEFGLEPLAILIKEKNLDKKNALKEAEKFITKDVIDSQSALFHALNIIIQEISDSPVIRKQIREFLSKGNVESKIKRGKKEEGKKYKDYFEFSEKLNKIASHRVMAILRGEKEGILNLSVCPEKEKDQIARQLSRIHFEKEGELLLIAAEESFNRHLHKSIGNELLKEIRERAEKDSLEIFSRNLENILLYSPFGEKPLIGVDPGIKTGCKSVVIDEHGDYIESKALFLHQNARDAEKLLEWAEKYKIKGIAIGNGTFGREAYKIINKLFEGNDIMVALVDEDGASIYSAGEIAREEFPELDVTIRGAISIGRRFQDPMAELVKINPESLGVGQYQHDITSSLLKNKLAQTIEWAVNKIGVNINTASYHLLSYISGLDKTKAKEIAKARSKQKKILSIDELKNIKGIGEKAFEQSAGFLRIRDGKNVLDSTGAHPESYGDIKKIAELFEVTIVELVKNPEIIDKNKVKASLKICELDSIIDELKQKGLDPRVEYKPAAFSDDIESINDLNEGQILNGIVDNVTAFGAFIDLGIKNKGLVHISEVSDNYIKDINNILSVGDEVTVKVINIDIERNRIALSIKQAAH